MAFEWKHLDAEGNPLQEDVEYSLKINDSLFLHGTLFWHPQHGYMLCYTTRNGILIGEHQTQVPYIQKKGRVLVYDDLRRKSKDNA